MTVTATAASSAVDAADASIAPPLKLGVAVVGFVDDFKVIYDVYAIHKPATVRTIPCWHMRPASLATARIEASLERTSEMGAPK